jgi:hypothetical protein
MICVIFYGHLLIRQSNQSRSVNCDLLVGTILTLIYIPMFAYTVEGKNARPS